jgi:hypothetical protein
MRETLDGTIKWNGGLESLLAANYSHAALGDVVRMLLRQESSKITKLCLGSVALTCQKTSSMGRLCESCRKMYS